MVAVPVVTAALALVLMVARVRPDQSGLQPDSLAVPLVLVAVVVLRAMQRPIAASLAALAVFMVVVAADQLLTDQLAEVIAAAQALRASSLLHGLAPLLRHQSIVIS